MKKFLLCLLLLTLSTPSPAGISLVGAMNLNRAAGTFSSSGLAVSWGNTTTFGFGALFSGDSNPVVNLEAGLLYMPRRYDEGFVLRELKTLEVPVMLRFGPVPFVTFAVGGYFSRVIDSQGNDTVFDSNDYGLGGSIAVRIPIVPMVGAIIDGRYLHGLANLDKRVLHQLNRRDFQILAGIDFTL